MKSLTSRVSFVVILLAVLGVGYFARLGKSADVPPPGFSDARDRGSAISQEIVTISNDFTKELEKVNALDKEGKQIEAIDITLQMNQGVADLKTRAIDLSKELDKMAGALSGVRSEEARLAAADSITNRMALISRLLSYSDYLNQLSLALKDRFQESPKAANVGEIVAKINSEVSAINDFNKSAQEAMDRFDQVLSESR